MVDMSSWPPGGCDSATNMNWFFMPLILDVYGLPWPSTWLFPRERLHPEWNSWVKALQDHHTSPGRVLPSIEFIGEGLIPDASQERFVKPLLESHLGAGVLQHWDLLIRLEQGHQPGSFGNFDGGSLHCADGGEEGVGQPPQDENQLSPPSPSPACQLQPPPAGSLATLLLEDAHGGQEVKARLVVRDGQSFWEVTGPAPTWNSHQNEQYMGGSYEPFGGRGFKVLKMRLAGTKNWRYSLEFKLRVTAEYSNRSKSAAHLAKEHDINRRLISCWFRQRSEMITQLRHQEEQGSPGAAQDTRSKRAKPHQPIHSEEEVSPLPQTRRRAPAGPLPPPPPEPGGPTLTLTGDGSVGGAHNARAPQHSYYSEKDGATTTQPGQEASAGPLPLPPFRARGSTPADMGDCSAHEASDTRGSSSGGPSNKDDDVIIEQVIASPYNAAASQEAINAELRSSGMVRGSALPFGNCAPESLARSLESFGKEELPWRIGDAGRGGTSWVRLQAADGWEAAANAVTHAVKGSSCPAGVMPMEAVFGSPLFSILRPFLSSRSDFPEGRDRDEWQDVSVLVSLAAQGTYREGCAEALREYFTARCSVNRDEAQSILRGSREVSSHWAWWNESDFAMFTWATKTCGGMLWEQNAVAYLYFSTDQKERLQFLELISASQPSKKRQGLDGTQQMACRNISKCQEILAASNPAWVVVYDSISTHFSPVLADEKVEGSTNRSHRLIMSPGGAAPSSQNGGRKQDVLGTASSSHGRHSSEEDDGSLPPRRREGSLCSPPSPPSPGAGGSTPTPVGYDSVGGVQGRVPQRDGTSEEEEAPLSQLWQTPPAGPLPLSPSGPGGSTPTSVGYGSVGGPQGRVLQRDGTRGEEDAPLSQLWQTPPAGPLPPPPPSGAGGLVSASANGGSGDGAHDTGALQHSNSSEEKEVSPSHPWRAPPAVSLPPPPSGAGGLTSAPANGGSVGGTHGTRASQRNDSSEEKETPTSHPRQALPAVSLPPPPSGAGGLTSAPANGGSVGGTHGTRASQRNEFSEENETPASQPWQAPPAISLPSPPSGAGGPASASANDGSCDGAYDAGALQHSSSSEEKGAFPSHQWQASPAGFSPPLPSGAGGSKSVPANYGSVNATHGTRASQRSASSEEEEAPLSQLWQAPPASPLPPPPSGAGGPASASANGGSSDGANDTGALQHSTFSEEKEASLSHPWQAPPAVSLPPPPSGAGGLTSAPADDGSVGGIHGAKAPQRRDTSEGEEAPLPRMRQMHPSEPLPPPPGVGTSTPASVDGGGADGSRGTTTQPHNHRHDRSAPNGRDDHPQGSSADTPQLQAARRAVAQQAAFVGAASQPLLMQVPGPRELPSGDMWSCIDKVGVWDTYLNHLHMSKDVPQPFHERWARAQLDVLQRVESALRDPDPLALERAMKWFFLHHQLLLRTDNGRTGPRLERIMRRRFDLWETGQLDVLMNLWQQDRRRAETNIRPMNDSSRVKMAVKLIEEGCVTKALSHIGGEGLGDLSLHAIQGQLAAKSPQEREDWASPVTTSTPRFDTPDVRKYYKNLRRRAGVGADGFRNEYLLRLIRGQVGEATRAQVLQAHQQFADHVINGDLPPWFYVVWTSVVAIAPIKSRGETPASHDVRPVGQGGILRRAIAGLVKGVSKTLLKETCEPVQLGQGTSGGTQALGLIMRLHMDMNPDHILVKVDFKNAFNAIERAAIMRELAARPALAHLLRYFESEMRPVSKVFYLSANGKLEQAEYNSVNGGQQGAFSAGSGFNNGSVSTFEETDAHLGKEGGIARAICDDLILAGPAHAVWEALALLEPRARMRLGLVLQRYKSEVWSPSGNYGNKPPEVKIGKLVDEKTGETGFGILGGGVALGDDLYQKLHIRGKVNELCGEIKQIHHLLLSNNSSDHAFQVDRLSHASRLVYFTQTTVPGTPGVAEELERYDALRYELQAAALGGDPRYPDARYCSMPSVAHDRVMLARRWRGLGWVSAVDTWPAAFVGAVDMVVPRLADRPHPLGGIEPGLAPHLEAVVGTGEGFSKPVGRYRTFLASGLNVAAAFGKSWEDMRIETGGDPEGTFAVPAADAPGPVREEDRREEDELRPHVQRWCTSERQRSRAYNLREQVGTLNPMDPLRVAHDQAGTGSLFGTLPKGHTSASSVLSTTVAVFLGIPIPKVVAALDGGITSFRCRKQRDGRNRMRELDAHGYALSKFVGEGHYTIRRHNAMEDTLADSARSAGINAVQQLRTIYVNDVDHHRRRAFEQSQRLKTAQQSTGDHGVMVPDVTFVNFVSRNAVDVAEYGGKPKSFDFDVKGCGFLEHLYSPRAGRGVPMQRRADSVRKEWTRKAAEADRVWNNVPKGVDGPIQRRLRSRPGIKGLAFGFFGEWSREVDDFIAEVAKNGGSTPERFGCCHGVEQATRVVSSWARERIGRLALRESAMAIEVALDIALGNQAVVPEKAAEAASEVWDVWDGSGNRPAMPSII